MELIIVKNYEEISKKASEIVIDLLTNQPDAKLGLATGSSPIGLYQCLIEAYQH